MDATFDSIYRGLNEHPTAALLALALCALYLLWRDGRESARAHAAQIEALHAANLQTAMQIVPLTAKLVDAVESVERGYSLALQQAAVQQRLTGGGA